MWQLWRSLIEIRGTELQLYWTKFYLVLFIDGGLFALLKASSSNQSLAFPRSMIPGAGLVLTGLGLLLLRGAAWWVRWWEGKLRELEKAIHKELPDDFPINVFEDHPHYKPPKRWRIPTFKTAHGVMWIILVAWLGILIVTMMH